MKFYPQIFLTDNVTFSAEHDHELDHIKNPAWLIDWSRFEQIVRISGNNDFYEQFFWEIYCTFYNYELCLFSKLLDFRTIEMFFQNSVEVLQEFAVPRAQAYNYES